MPDDVITIQPVPPEGTYPLRQQVLRPGQPSSEVAFAGDDADEALHLAAVDGDGQIIGIASIYPEPPPGEAEAAQWRLRGMAVDPRQHGQGVGRRLVEACLAHLTSRGGRTLWCNARMTAAGFYARLGFTEFSETFDIPGVGPHVRMRREA